MLTTLNASRHVIPNVPVPSGTGFLSIIITKGIPYMDLLGPVGSTYTGTAGTFTLSKENRIVTGLGPLKKKVNDEDGDITADNISLTFQDCYAFKGTHSLMIGPQEWNLEGTGKSLLETIFSDPDANYYVWLQFTKEGGTVETFFGGEVNPLSIPKKYSLLHLPHTVNERRLQSVEIQLVNSSARLKRFTASHFIDGIPDILSAITEAEVDSHAPFYGGFIPADYAEGIMGTMFEEIIKGLSSWDTFLLDSGKWNFYVRPAIFGGMDNDTYPAPAFPQGVWGITFPQILQRISKVAGFKDFDAADFQPAFQYGRPEYATGTNTYNTVVAPPDEIAVNYNWVFGVSPFDGSPFESPVTYKRNATLSDMLKTIFWQFGVYNWADIDQTDGSTQLRLLPRNRSNGPIPTNWVTEIEDAQEEPRKVRAKKVEVKNLNAKGVFVCPGDVTGDSYSIEMKFRVKSWGNSTSPTWRTAHLIYDGGLPIYDQDLAWRIEHKGQENNIHPNGWISASYLYWRNPVDTNVAYPPLYNGKKLGTWAGYHTITAQTEKAGIWEGRENALYSSCQFYSREIIGSPIIMKRRYAGCFDDDGTLRGVRPNMIAYIQVGGVLKEFKAKEIEQDIWNNTTLVSYEEVIDYDTTEDLYVGTYGDEGQETTGGGTGGGNSTANPNIGGGGGLGIPQLLQLSNTLPCTAVTIANVSLSGALSRTEWQGAFVDNGARILVNAQTDKKQNGIYIMNTGGAWARAVDGVFNKMIVPVAFWDNLYNGDARSPSTKKYTLVDYVTELIPSDGATQITSTEVKPIAISLGVDRVHFIPKGSFPIVGETLVVAKAVAIANVNIAALYSDTPGGTPPALVADGTIILPYDTVLLLNQTTPTENGLYVMGEDYYLTPVPYNVSTFTAVRVMYGSLYASSLWDFTVIGGNNTFRARTHWATVRQPFAVGFIVEKWSNYLYELPNASAPTLPPLATAFPGQKYVFKCITGAGPFPTVNPTVGELIDGGAGPFALAAWGTLRIMAPTTGNSWWFW
jgi:hypothetical protein